MSGTTILETLLIKIAADAGSYSKDLQKIVADTKKAMGEIGTLVTKATDPGKDAAARFAARAKAANKEAAQDVARAQKTDAVIAANHVKTQLGALDAVAKNRASLQANHDKILKNSFALEQKIGVDAAQAAAKQKAALQENHSRIVKNSFALEQKEADKVYNKRVSDFERLAAHTDRIRANSARLEQAENERVIQHRNRIRRNSAELEQRENLRLLREQRDAAVAHAEARAVIGRNIASRAPGVLRGAASGTTRVGTALTAAITAPALALGGASVNSFAQFDDAITRAVAVAGGVSDGMRKKMVDNAKAIGRSGIISSTDLAKGYMHLVQAGLSAAEATEALGKTQKFAVAGAMDMEHAIEMLIRSQTVLGKRDNDPAKNAENMMRVSDLFVRAANKSTASIEDFARATITKSGASARVLKMEMEELVATQVVLANSGIKAELAGEQLAIVMRDTQAASIKHREVWERFGIAAYDAAGKYRGLIPIIKDLERATGGMSDEQRKTTLKLLGFQERSVLATYVLLGLSGQMEAAYKDLKNLGNETERVAKIIESSFLSQLKILWNQLTVIAQEIGEVLAPYLKRMSEYVQRASKWWGSLSDSAKKALVAFVALAAAAGPLIVAVGMFIGSLAAVASGIAAVVALGPEVVLALTGIGAGAVATGAALAAMGAGLVRAFQKMNDPKGYQEFNDQIAKMLGVARDMFRAFGEWTYEYFVPRMKEAAHEAGKVAAQAFKEAFLGGGKVYAQDLIDKHERNITELKGEKEITPRARATQAARIRREQTEIDRLRPIAAAEHNERFPSGPNLAHTFGRIIENAYGSNKPIARAPQTNNGSFLSGLFGRGGNSSTTATGGRGNPSAGKAGAVDALHSGSEAFEYYTKEASDARKENDRAEKVIAKLTASLKEQIATVGMSHHQITIWRLEQKLLNEGLDEEEKKDLAVWKSKIKHVEALEKEAKAIEKARTAAERLAEKHRSPQKEFKEEKAVLENLLKTGKIKKGVFDAALAELKEGLGKTHHVNVKLHILDNKSAEEAMINHIFGGGGNASEGDFGPDVARAARKDAFEEARGARAAEFFGGKAGRSPKEARDARKALRLAKIEEDRVAGLEAERVGSFGTSIPGLTVGGKELAGGGGEEGFPVHPVSAAIRAAAAAVAGARGSATSLRQTGIGPFGVPLPSTAKPAVEPSVGGAIIGSIKSFFGSSSEEDKKTAALQLNTQALVANTEATKKNETSLSPAGIG